MDLIRQYIIQCITSAANNLRLNTEKIEVVSLLRESICQADDLENEIRNMKKITELSTFAIKLNEIYNYIAKSKVDFLKVSEKFKEHCFSLVKDLSSVLEKVSPQSFRQIVKTMKENSLKEASLKEALMKENSIKTENILDSNNIENKVIIVKESENIGNRSIIERTGDIVPRNSEKNVALYKENERIKEEFLLETEKKVSPILFENYEEKILNPVKEIDLFLKNIAQGKATKEEIHKYYGLLNENAELSAGIGFDIIAGMHRIFASALKLIGEEQLIPDKDVISGMRASLIVVVAVIRGKDVDITGYLNKAEELGKRIQNLN